MLIFSFSQYFPLSATWVPEPIGLEQQSDHGHAQGKRRRHGTISHCTPVMCLPPLERKKQTLKEMEGVEIVWKE